MQLTTEERRERIVSAAHENGKVKYEITTPVDATAVIDGKTYNLSLGVHKF